MTHQEMEIRLKELEKQVKALKQESCEDWRKTSVFKVEMDGKIAEDIKKIKELNNQPLITGVLLAEPKVEVSGIVEVLDKIRAEIFKCESDFRLTVDDYTCSRCTDNVFNSIYGILDKYMVESEG